MDSVHDSKRQIEVGGPQVLTHNEIAACAFMVAGHKVRITHIPVWATRAALWLLQTLTSSKTYGPIEFFITVLSMDMIAPVCGEATLKKYFLELRQTPES